MKRKRVAPDPGMPMILLVDPRADAKEGLPILASGSPPEVEHITEFAKAKTRLSEEGFDLVLVSQDLGDQNGLDFLRISVETCPHIPVILRVPSKKLVEFKELALNTGAKACVADPCEDGTLAKVLNECLDVRPEPGGLADLQTLLGQLEDRGMVDRTDELDRVLGKSKASSTPEPAAPPPEPELPQSTASQDPPNKINVKDQPQGDDLALILGLGDNEAETKPKRDPKSPKNLEPQAVQDADSQTVLPGDETIVESPEKIEIKLPEQKEIDADPDGFLSSLLDEMEAAQADFSSLNLNSRLDAEIKITTVDDRKRQTEVNLETKTGDGFSKDDLLGDGLEKRIQSMEEGTLDQGLDESDDADDGEPEGGSKEKHLYSPKKRKNDPYLKIVVSVDLVEARLILYPHESDLFQANDIKDELEKQGIIYGVNTSRIDQLLHQVNEKREPALGELIAEGVAPEDAADAGIDFEFSVDSVLYLEEDDQGRVDFRDMYRVDSVREGDVLATIRPATEAKDGTSVFGTAIVGKMGKDSRVIPGRNVRYDPDSLKFFAEMDGQPCLKGSKVTVLPVYTVPHDVDYSTGNIDFLGTVIVSGNVCTGFSVTASEDIRVIGVVEGAVLKAGGEVYVKRGFMGGDKGEIFASKGIVLRYCSGGVLSAEGDILVEDSVVNTDISCKGKIRVLKGKGSIIGGTVRAVIGLDCLNIGSGLGVNTSIVVGEHFLIRRKLKLINNKVKINREKIAKTELGLKGFTSRPAGSDPITAEQETQVKNLKSVQATLKSKGDELQKMKDELLVEFKKKSIGKISVRNQVYPGVMIRVGNAVLKVEELFTFCSFKEDPYQPAVKLGAYAK